MRDEKLDIIRGFALLAITINHFSDVCQDLGLQGQRLPTLTQIGYSSSAELFFVISGYLLGQIHFRKPDEHWREFRYLISRAYHIYISNILLFIFLFATFSHLDIRAQDVMWLKYYYDDPSRVSEFMAFASYPRFLDILYMYVIFILSSAVLLPIILRKDVAAALLSIGLYSAVQLFPTLNLPRGSPGGDTGWALNPFAWQVLFVGGILLGRRGVLSRLQTRSSSWLIASLAALAVFTAIYILDRYGSTVGIDYELPGTDKSNLGPLRIAHLIVVFLCSYLVLTRIRTMHYFPLRWLWTVGSKSLDSFIASVCLSYFAGAFWLYTGQTRVAYLVLVPTIGLLLIASAYARQAWRRSLSRKRKPREAVTPEKPPAPQPALAKARS